MEFHDASACANVQVLRPCVMCMSVSHMLELCDDKRRWDHGVLANR